MSSSRRSGSSGWQFYTLFYRIKSLNGRKPTLYLFYGLILWGLSFVITKSKPGLKTPNFRGKDRTEDNLTE